MKQVNYMRFYLVISCLGLMLCGCVANPKTVGQDIYMAKWALVGAVNSVADAHDSGVLKGQDYEAAKEAAKTTKATLDSAQSALGQGKPASALEYLQVARGLLRRLANYVTASGG